MDKHDCPFNCAAKGFEKLPKFPFNDNLSPSAASNPMAIRSHGYSYLPPPLPPPQLVPIDGTTNPSIQKETRRQNHAGPLGDSFGLSFERRDLSCRRGFDEGYQSIDSMRSSDFPSPFGVRSLGHFRHNDSSIDRPPGPMSAVSFFSHASPHYYSPRMYNGDLERSPVPRTRRTNSGSVPDDVTVSRYETRDDSTNFPMETPRMRTLNIEDQWRWLDYYQAGQKRRASSPPSDDIPQASDRLRRREGGLMSRGSPTPRLTVIPLQGSILSPSSVSRSGSYTSNLTASSITGLGWYGRWSPNGLSPGGLPPTDPSSPYAALLSAVTSPRSAVSGSIALPSPHQWTRSEQAMTGQPGRPLASPRKLTEIPKNSSSLVAAKMKGPYMCECCPKKPKKFETEEELKNHEAEKQCECLFCGRRFTDKNEAEQHQNSLHVRRHSWSCSALTGYERAFHDSTTKPGEAGTCGYCGDEFPRSGRNPAGAFTTEQDWEERIRHIQDVYKFRECNPSKISYRADHFGQYFKHGQWDTASRTKWSDIAAGFPGREQEGQQSGHVPPFSGSNWGTLKRIAITAAFCSGAASLPLVAAQPHAVPNLILHFAFGITIATAGAIPPLRSSDTIPQAYWLAAYGTWGAVTIGLFTLELLRRPNALQRRLLSGTVLFTALNLLGTLSQNASSALDGIMNWGPLALTASLCIVSVLMDVMSPEAATGIAVGLVGGVPVASNHS
ncbi:hypothetical protein B0T25DRAFT_209264 [Lasiosphaeria hispida]|uniref:C2H2-type domain-containing protein n=1 Tax=Lasiosphaeria hispida TaxID=260671 RepID=A0AAJ0HIS6_9PEZI|nr:hypothetical protein B0T25DRAFT_209264 [Lasiosphaeria hispida]